MVEFGRAPTVDDVAAASGALSAVPTPFRVEAAGRSWYANCGWDAFGIGAALGVDSVIETDCGDCHEPIRIDVRDRRPQPTELSEAPAQSRPILDGLLRLLGYGGLKPGRDALTAGRRGTGRSGA